MIRPPQDATWRPRSFAEFWPYYLQAHRDPRCRALHYVGTGWSVVSLGLLIATGNPWWFVAGVIGAYGCAWSGHFFVEGNQPAAFRNPWWSLIGDYRMCLLFLAGRLQPHLEHARALSRNAGT